MKKDMSDRNLIELCARLFIFFKRSFGSCVEDVIFWFRDGSQVPAFAIRGNPWMIYKRILSRFPLYQRQHSLEITLATTLGIEQNLISNGRYVVGVSPQFSSGGDLSVPEFFEMIEGMISEVLGGNGYDTSRHPPHVTIIPYPGIPMTSDAMPIPFFSLAKKSVQRDRQPRWVGPKIEASIGFGSVQKYRSVNLCMISRTARQLHEQAYAYAVSPKRGKSPETTVLVTHSSSEDLLSDQAENGIESCGGLLYPSFAVGTIPASNFGPICLVLDPRLVLKDLSPFRKGSPNTPPDSILYRTDSWTPTMSEFLGSYSARAFMELSGNEDFSNYYRNEKAIYSLGPFNMASDASGEVVEVTTVTEMNRIVSRRSQVWKDKSYEQFFASLNSIPDADHYGYLEAKSISVIPISWVSVVAAPAHIADRVASYLSKFGFRGISIPMSLDADEQNAFYGDGHNEGSRDDWARLKYAWRVSRAVQDTGLRIDY
jgi:hypothetical protein